MRVLFPDNDLISEKQLLFMIGVVKSKQRDVAFFVILKILSWERKTQFSVFA